MDKKTRTPNVPLSRKRKRSTALYDPNGTVNKRNNDKPSVNSNSENSFLLDPNAPVVSLAEKVFFIDHIMESIFSELDKTTLFNCRLVCGRSEYFATKALQNVVNISFNRMVRYFEGNVFYSGSIRKRTIPALTDLMSNSLEFPCTSFSFRNEPPDAATPALELFFNDHVSYIEKLKLLGFYSPHDLKQLIFTLALNVKEITLCNVNARPNNESSSEKDDTEDEEQFQGTHKTHLDSTFTGRRSVWTNLKIFRCENPIPEIIIRRILESSPLAEVSVHHKNLHCLVKPRNMLHLVKKCVIDINPDDDDEDFDSLELVAKNHENNWTVEELEFSGFTKYEDLHQKLLDIVENILLSCSPTCTTLVLKTILENFQIPQMPRVKRLTFPYQISFVTHQPLNIFPEGASLANMFPSLKSLQITSRHYMLNVPIRNIFGGDDHPHPALPNVNDVTLQFRQSDGNLVRSFRKMFPSATIRNVTKF